MRRILSLIVVFIALAAACGADDPGGPVATSKLDISALAGPVCPVETDPPSPECAPRPVGGAEIVITDSEGAEVARATTEADGTVVIEVAAGDLVIVPQAVDGLLGTAPPVNVTLSDGQSLQVTVDYDTGIR